MVEHIGSGFDLVMDHGDQKSKSLGSDTTKLVKLAKSVTEAANKSQKEVSDSQVWRQTQSGIHDYLTDMFIAKPNLMLGIDPELLKENYFKNPKIVEAFKTIPVEKFIEFPEHMERLNQELINHYKQFPKFSIAYYGHLHAVREAKFNSNNNDNGNGMGVK